MQLDSKKEADKRRGSREKEPSVRSPVPIQPQSPDLIPPPVRARCNQVPISVRVEALWIRKNRSDVARVNNGPSPPNYHETECLAQLEF
ncbi:hypothetical protein KUCAC02_018416 [Chaenocephalus aceratus]|uniref:Uncharacterized protein n=1 Tax=Chaenocephalus aceratus TaxID=36190 RepID=A0ACB9W9Z5_CHAAC|nr:hypothetical protein KUCAC02_018416 [Chaenocephalus aceratus]